MNITWEQIAAFASDEQTVRSAEPLQSPRYWLESGQSERALWGSVQGGSVFQVQLDLPTLAYRCNCPSRKRPCRHAVGLLMLALTVPEALPRREEPEHVRDWIERRAQQASKASRAKPAGTPPADPRARQRRQDQRETRVRSGVEQLQLWLTDLLRRGLSTPEVMTSQFWNDAARRLTDAQAGGLAQRLRTLGEIPGSQTDWPQQLLAGLGRLQLLLTAFERIDTLPAGLAMEVRQQIGWNVTQEMLQQQGEELSDVWTVLGQREQDDDRIRSQWTWLQAAASGRIALLLNFAAGVVPFSETWLVGQRFPAALQFYPGTARLRARISHRGELDSSPVQLVGPDRVEEALQHVAAQLAEQPWLMLFPVILRQVALCQVGEHWGVRDAIGDCLKLSPAVPWQMLAATGGTPTDLFGEWNGRELRLQAFILDGIITSC